VILDTSFLIDFMNGDKRALLRKARLDEDNETYRISPLTVFELWVGIMLSGRKEEEKRKVTLALLDIDVVKLDNKQAARAGEIHGLLLQVKQDIDVADSLIAASALLNGETVLTRNSKHFGRVPGLRVETY
jgi:tRNA(fMet)-specific endonuclease VapC